MTVIQGFCCKIDENLLVDFNKLGPKCKTVGRLSRQVRAGDLAGVCAFNAEHGFIFRVHAAAGRAAEPEPLANARAMQLFPDAACILALKLGTEVIWHLGPGDDGPFPREVNSRAAIDKALEGVFLRLERFHDRAAIDYLPAALIGGSD
ncbi:hypothetical protein [Mesorhizobium jarvisii]|uniref:hypothetical protein n=1 Tax=Mesorhizobium jarvisii TaxID=1777867 RepID=UPI0012DAFE76|nr:MULTISPECIES: hypothetical protein [Mesorhizobium]